jgi:hypothetical protein
LPATISIRIDGILGFAMSDVFRDRVSGFSEGARLLSLTKIDALEL